MADYSQIEPFPVHCDGGLVLDEAIDQIDKGAATVLENFEPDIEDGYRRILGFEAYDAAAVGATPNDDTNVLGIGFRGAQVVACAGADIAYSTGSGWTDIDTSRTSAGRYKFDTYRWGGALTIAMADDSGLLAACKWDGTTFTTLNGTGAPTAPHDVVEFQKHLFLAEGNTITFSSPFDDTDYDPANGAGSFIVPSDSGTIIKMKSRRDILFIFCSNNIYKITGRSIADFNLTSVTKNIGCVDAWSIQEFAGDIIFLAADGLRTIESTESIDDTIAISTASTSIQPLLKGLNQASGQLGSSCVIRSKSQYRYWYNTGVAVGDSLGIIATYKKGATKNQITGAANTGWQFSQIVGMKPTFAASTLLTDTGTELIVHGEADGIVYKQESTNTFNGTNMIAKYRTPDIIIEDKGLNKAIHRILLNLDNLGSASVSMKLEYNIGAINTPQPEAYIITATSSPNVYGTEVYGTATYAIPGIIEIRQAVEGSGFLVAVEFTESSASSPFSFKNFLIEFEKLGRR